MFIRSVTKVKLVTKFKRHNQLYFGTLVLTLCCYCGYNTWNMNFFQITVCKESNSMAIKNILQ